MKIQRILFGVIAALGLGGVAANVAAAELGQVKPQVVRDLLWGWGNPEMGKPGQHALATFASASPTRRAELLGAATW